MEHLQVLTDRTDLCGFEGNADLYGCGIRLGLYFQLFSTICVQYLGKENYSKYYRLSNLAMLLSILIVVIKESVNRSVIGVEASNIAWIISTTLICVSLSKTDNFYTALYLTTGLVYSVYMCWLYFHGLDILPRSTCPDDYEFFFAKVSLWHWYRTLSKVIFVIVCIGTAFSVIFFLVAWSKSKANSDIVQRSEGTDEETHRGGVRSLGIAFLCSLGIFTISSVPGVLPTELVMHWNKIHGVYSLDSVGQLIPFILGLGQLLDVLYRLYAGKPREERRGDDNDELCPKLGHGAIPMHPI